MEDLRQLQHAVSVLTDFVSSPRLEFLHMVAGPDRSAYGLLPLHITGEGAPEAAFLVPFPAAAANEDNLPEPVPNAPAAAATAGAAQAALDGGVGPLDPGGPVTGYVWTTATVPQQFSFDLLSAVLSAQSAEELRSRTPVGMCTWLAAEHLLTVCSDKLQLYRALAMQSQLQLQQQQQQLAELLQEQHDYEQQQFWQQQEPLWTADPQDLEDDAGILQEARDTPIFGDLSRLHADVTVRLQQGLAGSFRPAECRAAWACLQSDSGILKPAAKQFMHEVCTAIDSFSKARLGSRHVLVEFTADFLSYSSARKLLSNFKEVLAACGAEALYEHTHNRQQEYNNILQPLLTVVRDGVIDCLFRSPSVVQLNAAPSEIDSVERQKLYYITGYLVSDLIVREFMNKKRKNVDWTYVRLLEALKINKSDPLVPEQDSSFQKVRVESQSGWATAGKSACPGGEVAAACLEMSWMLASV